VAGSAHSGPVRSGTETFHTSGASDKGPVKFQRRCGPSATARPAMFA